MTHCNEHLQVKLIGQKGIHLVTHQSPQCHQDERRSVGEAGKKEKQRGLFVVVCLGLLLFVLFLFLFAFLLTVLFSLVGDTAGVRGGYGGTGGKQNWGA